MIKLRSEIASGSSTSRKGHICSTKPFLLKMGCETSGCRFLKFWFFYAVQMCHFHSALFYICCIESLLRI